MADDSRAGAERKKALTLAISQIEKQLGKGSIMRMGADTPRERIGVIPTGAINLDAAIGIGGVPRGRILSFTMLAGVMLSDVPEPSSGNLVVWPGTHALYEEYFRRRGPGSLLEGMPDVPLGEPVAVTGRAACASW